jgi:hypothetical protein
LKAAPAAVDYIQLATEQAGEIFGLVPADPSRAWRLLCGVYPPAPPGGRGFGGEFGGGSSVAGSDAGGSVAESVACVMDAQAGLVMGW